MKKYKRIIMSILFCMMGLMLLGCSNEVENKVENNNTNKNAIEKILSHEVPSAGSTYWNSEITTKNTEAGASVINDEKNIYYTTSYGEAQILKSSLNGENKEVFYTGQEIYCLNNYNEWIYFVEEIGDGSTAKHQLRRINKNTKVVEEIVTSEGFLTVPTFRIYKECGYMIVMKKIDSKNYKGQTIKINLESNEVTELDMNTIEQFESEEKEFKATLECDRSNPNRMVLTYTNNKRDEVEKLDINLEHENFHGELIIFEDSLYCQVYNKYYKLSKDGNAELVHTTKNYRNWMFTVGNKLAYLNENKEVIILN